MLPSLVAEVVLVAVLAVALVMVMVHVASRRKRKRLPVHRALVYVLLFKRRKCVIVFGWIENLWNAFKRLRATWISVEPRSLLVTRHDPSTFRKIGSKNATNF